MNTCYIYDTIRTPRGKGKKEGALHQTSSLNLILTCLNHLSEKHQQVQQIEECILGCVMPTNEQGGNIARAAVLASALPNQCGGIQLNRFCSSGLDAINMVASNIKSGTYKLAIAGGVESMSRVPMMSDGGAMLADPQVAYDHQIIPQGVAADLIATQSGYQRQQLDEWAVLSHARAHQAQTDGCFQSSIVPVRDPNHQIILSQDECIREHCSLAGMKSLQPAFEMMAEMAGFDHLVCEKFPEIERVIHHHHAGNSSAIADGACALLMGKRHKDLKPRARIIGFAQCAGDPTIMLTQPAHAARKALKSCGLTPKDIDIWEINEAFSSVVLHTMDQLDLQPNQVNCHGGAIAMGHPLGATGAILVAQALDLLEQQQKKRALITLCTALGMGVATIIERIDS